MHKNNKTNSNKDKRAKEAEHWLKTLDKDVNKLYVDKAIQNTTYYLSDAIVTPKMEVKYEKTNVAVYYNDISVCTKAALNHGSKEDHVCVLDFASFTNPGGGFLKGSLAQEEDLCRVSGLYPCLASKKDYYERHKSLNLDGRYNNDFIYVNDCPFFINGKVYLADIIVSAAPNLKRTDCSGDELDKLLRERMEIIFTQPYSHGVNILLLGAYGCGVFGNDPKQVAEIWKDLIAKYDGVYKNVTFAVKDKDMSKVFKGVL